MSGDRNNPQPSARNDSGLRAEHAYLLTGVFSLSAAVVLYIVDFQAEDFDINRGAYAILVSFFVAGYCGWLSRSAERRGQVGRDELRQELAALRQEIARGRAVSVPQQRKSNEGRAYMSTAAGGEGDTMPVVPPETMAVLRRINMKIVGREDPR